jgi:type II secretory pathway predicted ATPase ExeA
MSAALVAPSGTGKTALLRALAARLPETRYRYHYVKVTDLSKRDFCREIAAAIGIEPVSLYPTLVRRLQERFVATIEMDSLRPVLFLDEAHDIRPDVLGIIRLLTNFDMDSRLVVSILLVGQPRLSNLLKDKRLEDVAQRMGHYAVLGLLSRKESDEYVRHRCHIAGNSSCPFDRSALEAIFDITHGNLRAMDHLAIKSLERADKSSCNTVDSNHVIAARGTLCL